MGGGANAEGRRFRELAAVTLRDVTESDGSLKHEFKIVCF
jgi:hypothetical protein